MFAKCWRWTWLAMGRATLLSTAQQRLPQDTLARIRLMSTALGIVFLLLVVPAVVTSPHGNLALRATLLALFALMLWGWYSWARGAVVRPLSLSVEAMSIALAVHLIESQPIVGLVTFAGICIRPYYVSGRQTALTVAIYSATFLTSTAYFAPITGSLLTAEILIQPVMLSITGGLVFFISRNVSRQSELLRELEASHSRYRSLVETIPGAIITSSPDGSIRYVSPQAELMFGTGAVPEKSKWGQVIFRHIHPDDREYAIRVTKESGATGQDLRLECRAHDQTGKLIWIRIDASFIDDGSPAAPYWQSIITDVTERHELFDKLAYQAHHDSLTGLPNRKRFYDRVEHALARNTRGRSTAAVAFLDLDNFKLVNDGLGHEAGDRLIVATAARLSACVRPGDTVARLGGDEFGLLFESLHSQQDALAVARRIESELRKPFDLDGETVFTSTSIGIAFTARSRVTTDELIRRADVAMYAAKRAGKANTVIYEPTMDHRLSAGATDDWWKTGTLDAKQSAIAGTDGTAPSVVNSHENLCK